MPHPEEEPVGLSRSEHLSFCDDLIENGTATLDEFQFLRWEVSRLEARLLALRKAFCVGYCKPPDYHRLECIRTCETLEITP